MVVFDATFRVIYFPLRFEFNTKNATKILGKISRPGILLSNTRDSDGNQATLICLHKRSLPPLVK